MFDGWIFVAILVPAFTCRRTFADYALWSSWRDFGETMDALCICLLGCNLRHGELEVGFEDWEEMVS
jgi:hypothetical protein